MTKKEYEEIDVNLNLNLNMDLTWLFWVVLVGWSVYAYLKGA